MTIIIEFESQQCWIVNVAGYIISTEPEVTELTGSRVADPLKKIKEGDRLNIVRLGETTKLTDRVQSIKYLD